MTWTQLGKAMYTCGDCMLVPGEYAGPDNPYFKAPNLDKAFAEGRESWLVPYGSMTLVDTTMPLHCDIIPCSKHLMECERLAADDGH